MSLNSSVDTITDQSGAVVERLSYDAWGKRRIASGANAWRDAALPIAGTETRRGFTGHEHLDEFALIHMNGRVYDPSLGRFLSADPFIQFPASTQGLNRYSYVFNNPLSFTDPSGYFLKWIGRKAKKIVRGVGKALKKVLETPIVQSVLTIAAGIYCGPQCAAAASAAFTAINGGSLSDVLFAAAVAYVSAEAFAEVGKAFPEGDFLTAARLKRTLAHGVVGGAMAEASGGRFRDGFVGAGAAQLAAPWIDGLDTGNSGISHARVTAAAVVGGTASKLGGGKFANGAVTAAFGRLFNDEADRLRQQQEAKLLGEVNGVGSSRTFDADNRIRVEPYSHTLGPDSFFYEIDYHYYDTNDRLIPNYVPSDAWGNAVPAFTGRALPGFGGGGPDPQRSPHVLCQVYNLVH